MTYKELQEEARGLGLKYVGVSKKKLEKLINATKSDSYDNPPVEKEPVKESPKANVAIVSHKGQEIRRYSVEVHGNKFVDLARQFAERRDYDVKIIEVKSGVNCPNCGSIVSI